MNHKNASYQLNLIIRYKNGDKRAVNELIEAYSKYIRHYIKRFKTDQEDLYQEGCIGLVEAIDKYDVTSGTHPFSFISPNITGKIKYFVANFSRVVRTPCHAFWDTATRAQVMPLADSWDGPVDAPPSDEELMSRMIDASIQPLLERMRAAITPEESKLLDLRFAEELSLLEAGKKLVVGTKSKPLCPEGIRQWELRIFKNLRKQFAKKAPSYDEWLISSLTKA